MGMPLRGWYSCAALGMIGGLACTGACAQVSGSVAVDSDYRVRGVSLSDSKPTLRAALNYDAAGGGYVGMAWAGVESVYGDRYLQATPYAGFAKRLSPQQSLEVGVTYAHFGGDSDHDYGEAYLGWLAEHWNARVFYAPDYFGGRVRTLYAELDLHLTLTPVARLFAHAGVLAPIGAPAGTDARMRADVRLGTGCSVGDVDLQLAWSGRSRGGPEPAVYRGGRTGFVTSASFSF